MKAPRREHRPRRKAVKQLVIPYVAAPRMAAARPKVGAVSKRRDVAIYFGPAEDFYDSWPAPTCIVVDGPYGIKGFPGDPPTHDRLADWYRPHIEAWSRRATPQTTLWFWGTEVGWATVHGALIEKGWEYRNCHVWNKGVGHIAGNANSQTLRKFPVVTEVCAQYVKPPRFSVEGRLVSMQAWLRHEWMRSGLPMYLSNQACGVKNAATRKYLTSCHLWYFPPVEAFERMSAYVNKRGLAAGRPYFSIDGKVPVSGKQWEKMRAKFYCTVGVTNIWNGPALRGPERVKGEAGFLHTNQKPLRFIDLIVQTCTDEGDVVWEPFGGLCPGAVVSHRLRRRYVGAEILPDFYSAAAERLASYDAHDTIGTDANRPGTRLASSVTL